MVGGPNSAGIALTQNNDVGPQCYNCTNAASVSFSSTSSTAASGSLNTSLPAITVTVTPVGTPQPPTSSSTGLGGGAIAGIVIGVVAALAFGGALAWLLCLRRRSRGGTKGSVPVDPSHSNRVGVTRAKQSKAPVEESPAVELSGKLRVAEKDASDRVREPAELGTER